MSIYDEGDPGLAWAEADAANADGQAVIDAEQAAEAARQAEIAKAVRQLDARINTAQEATHAALATLKELTVRLYDIELAESARGGEILGGLQAALAGLWSARAATASRLKEIADEELLAEVAELRAENTRLREQLGSRL